MRKVAVSIVVNDGYVYAKDEDLNVAKIQLPIGEAPKNTEKMRGTFRNQLLKMGDTIFKCTDINVLGDNIPFLPVSQLNDLRRELLQLLSNERLRNYKRNSQNPICYADYPESKIDYRGNVFNENAKQFYANCNCEVLDDALEVKPNIPSGIELMRTKHCLKFAAGLCGQPCKKLYLVDVKGKKYPLKFDCKNCEMAILSP